MRILIEGASYADYLAKCHEAFRSGLRATFDTRLFGRGYPAYTPRCKTYAQIIQHVFPDAPPDVIVGGPYSPADLDGLKYAGLATVPALRVFLLSDYWDINDFHLAALLRFIHEHKFDLICSYFPQPLDMWRHTPIGHRLVFLPPCFDPAIFNDWQMPRIYDVAFLASGTVTYSPHYPERYRLHQQLLQRKDLHYLYAAHPGWQRHRNAHPLVGKNFSRAINSSKIFITTSGIYRNPQQKIFEALASNVLLLAEEPLGADCIGLEDGVNYVKITEDDMMDKIDYYLAHPDLRARIAEAGYQWAMRRHSCYVRAIDFYEQVRPYLGLG